MPYLKDLKSKTYYSSDLINNIRYEYFMDHVSHKRVQQADGSWISNIDISLWVYDHNIRSWMGPTDIQYVGTEDMLAAGIDCELDVSLMQIPKCPVDTNMPISKSNWHDQCIIKENSDRLYCVKCGGKNTEVFMLITSTFYCKVCEPN